MTHAVSLLLAVVLSGCFADRAPRSPSTAVADDPSTNNDESNDQAVGDYGTVTLCVSTPHNGRSYTLDADVDDSILTTVYFPKGGNVDFDGCELDDDLAGSCEDENGKTWDFDGEC